MNFPNDGGPAFPQQPIYSEQHGWTHPAAIGDSFVGMSLRDWFAGQEDLGEFNDPESSVSESMTEELAGRPKPEGGWVKGNFVEMLKWDAEWRAAMKYIRADAMIAAREKGLK